MVFLLWNLVKECKLALKKSHNLPHNSPILLHNLPRKYRTISDFLSHSIRWPAKRRLYCVSRDLTTGSLVLGLQSSFCRHPTTNCRLQDCTWKLNEGKNIAKRWCYQQHYLTPSYSQKWLSSLERLLIFPAQITLASFPKKYIERAEQCLPMSQTCSWMHSNRLAVSLHYRRNETLV